MVEADSAFDQVPLTAFAANGLSVTVALPPPSPPPAAVPVGRSTSGINITNGGVDDIEAGDLIMLTKGNSSSLVQVTSTPTSQQIFFDVGDSLSLNQTLAASGTLTQLRALAPADDVVDAGGLVETIATRIRLITYYLDVTTDPRRPRLVRRSNNGHPTELQQLARDRRGLRRREPAVQLRPGRRRGQPDQRADGRRRSRRHRHRSLLPTGVLAEPDPQGQHRA